mgnify:CR=1 FL=1
MSQTGERDPWARFEEAWRRWLDRPPRRSGRDAALRLVAAVEARRRRYRIWFPSAAAAALILVVAITAIVFRPPRETRPPGAVIETGQPLPLGRGEVLIWLDEDTPLYMTFQSPEESREDGGKS